MMSLTMAIADFIPVLLFAASAVLLQRDMYGLMSKGAYALFAGGTTLIVVAGALKAIWKLLYAIQLCDFAVLNACFFPLQSVGFLLGGLGMIAYLFHKQGVTAYSAAPAVFSGTMLFVAILIFGMLGITGGLAVVAKRKKTIGGMVCFLFAFVFLLMMGYLSSRDFTKASMHWIAQCVNTVAQLFLLGGAVQLHRAMKTEEGKPLTE